MTPASRSVYYFGFYLLATAVTLTAFPNVLLSLIQVPETTEVWIRLLGVIVFALGLYYVFMAPANNALFNMLTVYVRSSAFVFFLAFVLIGLAPMQMMLFGVVDLACALWTYSAIRKG